METQQKTKGDLITLPLSKEWVRRAGISHFRGHTEALAEFYQTETFMMMTGPKWKVIPLTTHIPLKNVAKELSKFPWHSLSLALRKSKFSKKANLGVLGLNPHAGEGGKIGKEEFTILSQGMEILKKDGWKVEGPIPADSAFLPGSKKYEILLACYHDQGLIPFKLLEGKKGVNLTLGLDFLRVSPDHGTAFDIAGKGLASPEGLLSCLSLLSEKI